MRWSYKTVLFELKKEGLLGNVFLDESEIELSLNEFGATGWELISMIETRDGIIAVFKQPLGQIPIKPEVDVEDEEDVVEDVEEGRVVRQPSLQPQPVIRERIVPAARPVVKTIVEPEEDRETLSGIGSIRIE
ncbi:DUF4177 domain-containing protein [Desulfoprunum benzoelyticum]|uniref:DUF4177 domain-containing protein n=1 Tax=Desulfoprunum benzoelyticum TaxID=1506996 RepID=A0A840V1Q2_9BACT|nr:DUF4177 domain-containing protein [Desulfoprunum benzoelyticum]MBB5348778.1 hypothetical protein [Desulfoprunum benzoelyticum]MBM9529941.1 DUF4177 domain-containing protein [Desulfoprunum benzoelyticum]